MKTSNKAFPLIITAVTLALAGFLVYANTFQVPFILDDIPNILANPHIRVTSFTPAKILQITNSPTPRPLAHFTFAVNYYFHHYHLTGYHLVNLLIHLTTAFLIFLVARSTLRLTPQGINIKWTVALLSALLWLVHPLHTQSVTYIVQRMNALAALFYLLALFCYILARKRQIQHGPGSPKTKLLFTTVIAAAILGLAAKPNTAILPVTLFFYDWYFFQHLDHTWIKKRLQWIVVITLLFTITAAVYLGTSPLEKISAMYSKHDFTMTERLLTQPGIIVYYLSLLIFPHPARLNLDYDFPLSSTLLSPPTTVLPVIVLMTLIVLIIMTARKQRLLSFAILWFLLNLMIESSFLGLALIFEHRTYLPSIFPVIALSSICIQSIQTRWIKIGIFTVLLGIGGLWTYQRNTVWTDANRLWHDCANKSPEKARPYLSLGAIRARTGQPQRALFFYRKALALDAGDERIYHNLGAAYQELGDITEASRLYQQALTMNPRYAEAYNNLGVALAKTGQINRAIHLYQKALAINPDYAEAYNHLGLARAAQNNLPQAISLYRKALAINPQYAPAYNNLGLARAARNNLPQAISLYRKALAIKPDYVEAHVNLGVACLRQNRLPQAINHLRQALQRNPELVEAHVNLAIACAQAGQTDNAINHCHEALKRSPTCTTAMYNLGLIYQGQNRLQKALVWLTKAVAGSPENLQMRRSLADTLETTGKIEQAIFHFKAIHQRDPENLSVLLALGRLYARQKENQPATRIYEQLARRLPDNPTLFYNLACLYARQHEITAALQALQQALAKGYANHQQIQNDPDLAPLRRSDNYQKIIKKYR